MRKFLLLLILAVSSTIFACMDDTKDGGASYFLDYSLKNGTTDVATGSFTAGPEATGTATASANDFASIPGCSLLDTTAVKSAPNYILTCIASKESATLADLDNGTVDEVYIVVGSDTAIGVGTYTSNTENALVSVAIGGTIYKSSSASVSITGYDAVGGSVEGTYTATVTPDMGATSYTVSGSFNFKRAEDGLVAL